MYNDLPIVRHNKNEISEDYFESIYNEDRFHHGGRLVELMARYGDQYLEHLMSSHYKGKFRSRFHSKEKTQLQTMYDFYTIKPR